MLYTGNKNGLDPTPGEGYDLNQMNMGTHFKT